SNSSTIEPEMDGSELDSNVDDETSLSKNDISALLKRLKTLERLQVACDKEVKNKKTDTFPDDMDDDSSKKKKKKSAKRRKNYKKEDTSSSETEDTGDEFKRKNPKFPPTICDWAIRRMMQGIINNKRDTEKRKLNNRSLHNDNKKSKSGEVTNQAQDLEAPSSINNLDNTIVASTSSSQTSPAKTTNTEDNTLPNRRRSSKVSNKKNAK
ncbi:36047_t:CDS:2, partial [Racocetra persica]